MDEVKFISARFNSGHFTSAILNGYGNFSKTEFRENAFFDGIQFKNYANFVKACFKHAASFHWAVFNDYANFSDARFHGRTDFTNARFQTDVNFAYAIFDGTISLSEAIFNRINISWDSIKNLIEYNDIAYLGLSKNYNNNGQFLDADNCYYQYRLKRAARLKGSYKLIDFMSRIIYGYGIRPELPLLGLALWYIFSSSVYYFNNQAPSIIGALDLSFVILTTTTQIGNLTGSCRLFSFIERLSGWLLMASFLVVLAKKTIR